MKTKKLAIIFSAVIFVCLSSLGIASATPVLIGTSQDLLDDPLWSSPEQYFQDKTYNVNWLLDQYTPASPLPEDYVLPETLTSLGKYNVGSGWEYSTWGSDPEWITGPFTKSDTGTWSLNTELFTGPVFYSLKAGTEFALYYAYGETSGTWTTTGFNSKDLSHITFWTGKDNSQVPEPSTIMLFGLGCLGMAGIGRKYIS